MIVEIDVLIEDVFNKDTILISEPVLHLKFEDLSKCFSVVGNTAQNAVVLLNPLVLLSVTNL